MTETHIDGSISRYSWSALNNSIHTVTYFFCIIIGHFDKSSRTDGEKILQSMKQASWERNLLFLDMLQVKLDFVKRKEQYDVSDIRKKLKSL
jgi:hypothetical protein